MANPVIDPVKIDSDSNSFQNKISTATGNATLTCGDIVVKADTIRYNPENKDVEAIGHAQITDGRKAGTGTANAGKITYNLETHVLICTGASSAHADE